MKSREEWKSPYPAFESGIYRLFWHAALKKQSFLSIKNYIKQYNCIKYSKLFFFYSAKMHHIHQK